MFSLDRRRVLLKMRYDCTLCSAKPTYDIRKHSAELFLCLIYLARCIVPRLSQRNEKKLFRLKRTEHFRFKTPFCWKNALMGWKSSSMLLVMHRKPFFDIRIVIYTIFEPRNSTGTGRARHKGLFVRARSKNVHFLKSTLVHKNAIFDRAKPFYAQG